MAFGNTVPEPDELMIIQFSLVLLIRVTVRSKLSMPSVCSRNPSGESMIVSGVGDFAFPAPNRMRSLGVSALGETPPTVSATAAWVASVARSAVAACVAADRAVPRVRTAVTSSRWREVGNG